MSLHLCPIEPDDWSNGPDFSGDECPKCDGTGTVDGGSDRADLDMTCPDCGGSGFVEYEPFEDDC